MVENFTWILGAAFCVCKCEVETDSLPFEYSGKREKRHTCTPLSGLLLTSCEQAKGEGLAATTQASQDGSDLVSLLTQPYTKYGDK